MLTEREKMLAGELYDPLDPELAAARARDLCQDLNATRETESERRRSILRQLFAQGGDTVWMRPPFYSDYGANIELGERVFFNFNCVRARRLSHPNRRLHPLRARSANLRATASSQCGATPPGRVRQTDRHRIRRFWWAAVRSFSAASSWVHEL